MYLSVIPSSASELVVSGNSLSRFDNSSIIESITAVTVTFFSTTKCFLIFLACLCSWAIFSPMAIPSWMGDIVRQIRTGFDRVSPEQFFSFYTCFMGNLARAFLECVCVYFWGGSFQFFDSNFQIRFFLNFLTIWKIIGWEEDVRRGKRNIAAGPNSASNNRRIAFSNSQSSDPSLFKQFSRIHLPSSWQTRRSLIFFM